MICLKDLWRHLFFKTAANMLLLSILSGWMHFLVPAHAAFLYKSYVVKKDKGQDILCDPYIVQKDDYVTKIFKQRGEISHRDFPEFLGIFSRINPHISDINRILTDQHIFIPLKKLKKGSLPGQSTGIVTIPFVTISSISDIIRSHSSEYKIRRGDTVSMLISKKFGTYGSKSYKEGVKLLKRINPEITDINRIKAGQVIHLPDPSLKNQSWYQSIFDSSGNIIEQEKENVSAGMNETASDTLDNSKRNDGKWSAFLQVASVLNGKFYNKGVYYFPGERNEDFAINLSISPVIELKDKTRLLFPQNNIKKSDQDLIQSFWKKVKIVTISDKASSEQILDSVFNLNKKYGSEDKITFSDNGVVVNVKARWATKILSGEKDGAQLLCITPIKKIDEITPNSICRYLKQNNIIIKEICQGKNILNKNSKSIHYTILDQDLIYINPLDHKTAVYDLLTALGFKYMQNISITFPYAGMQIDAVSNLVVKNDGSRLLVDFGDIYGDAALSIKKTGINIIQLKKEESFSAILKNLFKALDVHYLKNPTFLAAKRPSEHNTSLTIPGFLVSDEEKSKILITGVSLDYELIQFFVKDNIKIILMGMAGQKG